MEPDDIFSAQSLSIIEMDFVYTKPKKEDFAVDLAILERLRNLFFSWESTAL